MNNSFAKFIAGILIIIAILTVGWEFANQAVVHSGQFSSRSATLSFATDDASVSEVLERNILASAAKEIVEAAHSNGMQRIALFGFFDDIESHKRVGQYLTHKFDAAIPTSIRVIPLWNTPDVSLGKAVQVASARGADGLIVGNFELPPCGPLQILLRLVDPNFGKVIKGVSRHLPVSWGLMKQIDPALADINEGNEILAFSSNTAASGFLDDIFLANPDGQRVRRLTFSSPPNGISYRWPKWSPDGKRILFLYSDGGRWESGSLMSPGNPGMVVRTIDNDQPGVILHEKDLGESPYGNDITNANWSPDGTRIAFEAQGQIYVIDPDGTNLKKLTSGDDLYYDSVWAPDGKSIIVRRTLVTYENGLPSSQDDGLYAVNVDGTGEHQLAASGNSGSWSADGEFISSTAEGIEIIDRDGTRRRVSDIRGFNFRWSPNGDRVGFDTHEGGGATSILAMNADGAGLVRIVQSKPHQPTNMEGWAWSPDGRSIVVIANSIGSADEIQIWAANGSGVCRRLAPGPSIPESGVTWRK